MHHAARGIAAGFCSLGRNMKSETRLPELGNLSHWLLPVRGMGCFGQDGEVREKGLFNYVCFSPGRRNSSRTVCC